MKMWNIPFPIRAVSAGAAFLSLSFFGSKVLALARDRLLAGTFGADERLDAYFAAFLVPDFLYSMLILGGISAVFLPLFSEYFHRSESEAWKFANILLHNFLVILALAAGILFFLIPWIIPLLVPGFSQEQTHTTVQLTRIMLLSPIFFGISSVCSGVLHYFQKFAIYALAPIVYNLSIIFGIVFLFPKFGMEGLAYGVVIGACAHVAIQLPSVFAQGFRYRLAINLWEPGFVKALRLMVPRTVGALSFHINVVAMTALASTLTIGSVAVFHFAHNLQNIPVGLIGIPFALAVFPVLSRYGAALEKEKFQESFSHAFFKTLFFIIPLSVLLFLIKADLVSLFLGTGKFGPDQVSLVASAFGLFLLGVFAFALIPLLVRTFFALQDTKTPALASVAGMISTVTLGIVLIHLFSSTGWVQETVRALFSLPPHLDMAVLALPLAVSLGGILQFALLYSALAGKGVSLERGTRAHMVHIGIGTFVLVLGAVGTKMGLEFLNLEASLVMTIVQVALISFVSSLCYLAYMKIFRNRFHETHS